MISKYRLSCEEMLTGKNPVRDMECDGFLILGLQRGRDGEWETASTRLHGVKLTDVANAMYSSTELRKVVPLLMIIDRMQNNPLRRMARAVRNWFGGRTDE